MKKIYIYIFKELFKTFFFALIVFTGILSLIVVAKEAITKGFPPHVALRLFPYTVPEQMRVTIPVVLLLGVTTFFARMAGSNEFTALKALGVPPWKVIWPVILFSFFMSILYIWFSEVAVPWGQKNVTSIIVAYAEEIIYSKLRIDHRLGDDKSGFEITVKGVENKRLISPTISKGEHKLTAQWAEIRIDVASENCSIVLHNFSGSLGGKKDGRINVNQDHEQDIPLDLIIPTDSPGNRPSKMPLKRMPQETERQEQRKKSIEAKTAALAAFSVCQGNFEEFFEPSWKQQADAVESIQKNLYHLKLEPQRRLAAGFSCLAFVWIGTTLSIWLKKTDIFASFFACFVPILLLYYPLLMLGLEWGKSGTTPPIFIWCGNLITITLGFWFYKIIHRY